MRKRFLVAYDISDKDRLRSVHRIMLGFGDPVQYSVFDCRLSEKEKVLLTTALSEIIDVSDDRILVVLLGPEEGRISKKLQSIGKQIVPYERKPFVV